MTPQIIACYDGRKYARLARVLATTAATHCPNWELRLSEVPMVTNEASKLKHWVEAVEAAPDGTPMLLMDADAMILRSMDDLWAQDFELAYTVRNPAWSKWPYNAGVIFVRASDRVRAFLRAWLAAELPLLLTTGKVRQRWLDQYGAVEQAALDQTLKAFDLKTLALPCVEWNCEDSSWGHADASTRIVHVKGAFRKAIFGEGITSRRAKQIAPLLKVWKQLDGAETAALYTPEWQQGRQKYRAPAQACLDAAFGRFGRPESLLDVGCGDGHLVTYARTLCVDAVGVDLSIAETEGPLQHADLTQPLALGRTFDQVLCWEVGEHLPEESADVLCDTLVRHLAPGGRLLFSAAHPGQTGKGHINEQPASYWRDKLAARGLHVHQGLTAMVARQWARVAPATPWYGQNLQIFSYTEEAPDGPTVVLTMRTAHRKKAAYLGGTLRRLDAQGIDLSALHLCFTSPDVAWADRELAGLSVGRHIPNAVLSPNANGLAQVRAGLTTGAEWIVLLEDDLVFCADFLGSLRRWLRDHDRQDRHVYRCFGFTQPPKKHGAAYDWPLEQLRGSQIICLRRDDAVDFLAWGEKNLATWCRTTPWRITGADPGIAFDKFVAAWATARWPGQPGVISHPYFVKHIGDKSSIHARGVRNDAAFGGESWRYQPEARA